MLLLAQALELAPRGFRTTRGAALALVEILHEPIDVERFFIATDVVGILVLELVGLGLLAHLDNHATAKTRFARTYTARPAGGQV